MARSKQINKKEMMEAERQKKIQMPADYKIKFDVVIEKHLQPTEML